MRPRVRPYVRRSIWKIKGAGYIFWHSKHEFIHILLGLLWAWFWRELWGEFQMQWVWLAMFGSVLPDVDHLFYFFHSGSRDTYSIQVKTFLKKREWRTLAHFIEHNHKNNTNLSYHNLYFVMFLLTLSVASYFYEYKFGVILFGAMISHYLYDIIDDYWMLGAMNPNWKRWGRSKKRRSQEPVSNS